MTTSFTIEKDIHFHRHAHGRQELRKGKGAGLLREPRVLIPRITRLMALAIRFEDLLRAGPIRDQADRARLGQVTRARISQILIPNHLAPEIQEEILFLPGCTRGKNLLLADLLPITVIADWSAQRRRWRSMRRSLDS
jgi:hypothetical protein